MFYYLLKKIYSLKEMEHINFNFAFRSCVFHSDNQFMIAVEGDEVKVDEAYRGTNWIPQICQLKFQLLVSFTN